MTKSKMSFDNVLDAVMMEEDEPTNAALLRWSQRFPEFRDSLTDFFATWAKQQLQAEHAAPTKIDEDRLVQRGVEYALEIARRQGRVVPAGTFELLQPFDEMVLAAVYALGGQGNAANVTDTVIRISGKGVLMGYVVPSLESLEERGLALARQEDAKAKRYYTVTVVGERSLDHARKHTPAIANFLRELQ